MTNELLNLFDATESDVDDTPTLKELVEQYDPPIELNEEDILEIQDEWDEPTIPIVTDEIFLLQLQLDSAKWLSQGKF